MRLVIDLFFLLAIPICAMAWAAFRDSKKPENSSYDFMALLYIFIVLQTMSVVIMESCIYCFCVNRAFRILAGLETESGKPIKNT